MNARTDTNTQILQTLQELLKWTQIVAYKDVKLVLENHLDSDIKKIIYSLSDGNKTQDDIIAIGKVSAGSVSKYWIEWSKIGLGDLIPVRRGKRFRRAFELEYFGIEVPKVSKKVRDKN